MIDRASRASVRATRRSPQRSLRPLTGAVALLVVFGAGVGADRILWQGGAAGAASPFTDSEEFATLQETWDLIHEEWVLPEEVDDRALIYGAAEGMVNALGDDGHSRFLDPESGDAFEEATRGEFTGIGVQLDFRDGLPVVVAPLDDSPAAEQGVRSGDVILEIDGQTTERLDVERVGDLIRGDEGTPVRVLFRRPGVALPFELELVRRKITIRPVSWRMLPDGVAHLRLSEFSVGASREVEAALDQIRARGATGVVLDLRGNPGGLVAEAIGVASQFMPEGKTVFQQQDRGEEPKPLKTVGFGGRWLEGPLVVLVDRGSASAAEIVGAALRDNGRARLLGERTFGTGTVLIPFEQPDGSIVLLGTALWLSADGERLWKVGVEPDAEVALPSDAALSRPAEDPEVSADELATLGDAQLRAAYTALTGEAIPAALPAPPAVGR